MNIQQYNEYKINRPNSNKAYADGGGGLFLFMAAILDAILHEKSLNCTPKNT